MPSSARSYLQRAEIYLRHADDCEAMGAPAGAREFTAKAERAMVDAVKSMMGTVFSSGHIVDITVKE